MLDLLRSNTDREAIAASIALAHAFGETAPTQAIVVLMRSLTAPREQLEFLDELLYAEGGLKLVVRALEKCGPAIDAYLTDALVALDRAESGDAADIATWLLEVVFRMSEPRPRSLLPLTDAQQRVVLAIADAPTLWESPNLFVSWLKNLGLGESPEALRTVVGPRR